MALTRPKPEQRRLAGQIAWERGKTIVNWPTTSSALSGLIQTLQAMPPLPIADWQVDAYKRLVNDCAARVEDFDASAYAELPEDRKVANQMIFELRKKLSRVEFHTAKANASEYLADEADAETVTV